MNTKIKWFFIFFIATMLTFGACESDNNDVNSEVESSSTSTSKYTLSNMAGVWLDITYSSNLSRIEYYEAQNNVSQIKDTEPIYGFKISTNGDISEVVLKMSTSSTYGGQIHDTFYASGETMYWMLSDLGSYLSGVVISDNEITYNGSTYFTINSYTTMFYFGGGLYEKIN